MPTNFTVLPVEDSPLSEPDYDGHILKEEDKEEPDTVAGPYSGESFLGKRKSCLDMQTEEQNFKRLTVKGLGFFSNISVCVSASSKKMCAMFTTMCL